LLNLQRRRDSLNDGFLKRWQLGPANSIRFWGFDSQAATSVSRLSDNDPDVFVDDDFLAYPASENKHDNFQSLSSDEWPECWETTQH